jgi:hypothetical protein
MATQSASPTLSASPWSLTRIASFDGFRALAWNGDVLYASRGYSLFRGGVVDFNWKHVGIYRPASWRNLTSSSRLSLRFFRDGFHALAVLPSGDLVAAVAGAIIRLSPGETEFHVSHRVLRGTRPLHLAMTPSGHIAWGEYFDNPHRDEVNIYLSIDRGASWHVAHTFAKREIRHVHNIVYDQWSDCFWILTGDNASECNILRASCDFQSVDLVVSGSQQTRAVALVPAAEGVYFSSDTPLEPNHVYFLDRRGKVTPLTTLTSSSIYGCRVGGAIFFSTMIEPSAVNLDREVRVYGSLDGLHWQNLLAWKKDRWPMGLFQYGNAFLPDGQNTSGLLAITTIAVERGDMETTLWRIQK